MSKSITEATNNINPEILSEIKSEVKSVMKEVFGVNSNKEVQEKIHELKSMFNSYDPKNIATAKTQVKNIVGDIILKVFSQDIYRNKILQDDSILKRFNDGYFLDYGNTKEYILEPITGFTNFDDGAFVPTKITDIPVESDTISFYQADGKTLETNSRKWVKEITLIEKNLIQYFLSGKTQEFIANKIANMSVSLLVGQLHEFLNFITTTSIKKVINDTNSQNAAEAWVNVFNTINDMKQASKDYAFGSSNIPRMSSQENLIIMGNPKVFQFLKNMKAFIFHSDLFQPIQDLVDSNFYIVPRKYTIGDNETIITTEEEYYLDDNTLIIIDTEDSFKIINVLDTYVEQMFARNISVARYKHLWYTWKMLKWGKVCKITCNKFLTDVNPN